MADRYLLESGAPDGYQLEDGSGVYLLEVPPASPVTQSGQITQTNLIRSPAIQGGYSTVPNLLLTTLALFAVGSQLVKREATLHSQKPAPAVQAFQVPNLLTSTLGAQVVQIPPGHQQLDSAPARRDIASAGAARNDALLDISQVVQIPTGHQQTDSAPSVPPVLFWHRGSNTLLLTTPPAGHQQTESSPPTPALSFWHRGTNTLLLTTPPAGHQQLDSATSVVQSQVSPAGSNLPILAPPVQPIPQGAQETANIVQTPAVKVDQPPNVLAQFPPPAAQPIPPGKQETDSAPPAQRIGSIVFARGVDPGPPVVVSDPLPIGKQETDSAPYLARTLNINQPGNVLVNFPPPPPQVVPPGKQETDSAPYLQRNLIVDQPANLLGSAIGLPPIASAQSEWMPTIAAPAVYSWLAPNATIRLTSVAQAIPPGQQHTDSAPAWNAPVQSFTAPNTLPFLPILTPIPQGQQHTDSAPYAPPRLNVDQPENLLCVVQPLPIGQQHTDSAPAWNAPVQSFTAPVIIPPIAAPFPPGVQHTDSAPVVTNAVWSRCSSSPPDTLPPGTSTPPPTVADVTGGWPVYAPRIRKKREPILPVIEQAESVSVSELSYKAKRDIRRAKLREKQVLDALKAIYAEQDAIQNAITLEQALIAADEDVILVLLALM